MKIVTLQLPDDPELYRQLSTEELPSGWASLPADRPSMAYGTAWLNCNAQLGLIVPSAVMPLEKNIVLNPRHPAMTQVQILDVQEFCYDQRMFHVRG